MKHYGREAFRFRDDGVTVTIPFAFEPEFVRARRESDMRLAGMDRDKADVLKCLENDPGAKLQDVADKTGMTLSSVKKAVSRLKADGFLRNDGTNRNSRWVVLRP